MNTNLIYKLFRESSGVTTDSRSVNKGQLFFALWGGNFNGNKYASDALEKGASWAVIDDPQYESDRTILVDDCLTELQALAMHHRKQLNIPVVAITGTNGKTTTKELLAAVLAARFRTHYTKGNLNNHIGVPLTILSVPEKTEMLIIEMGANHIGEIKALCRIANPGFGMITNIGTAHIEGFGSFEGVVRAKTELYEHLKNVNGVALYNDKDPLLSEKIFSMVNRAVPFSDPNGTPLILSKADTGMNLILDATYEHRTYRIKTGLFGDYNLLNIKAAIATGLFFGVPAEAAADAIEHYTPSNNRSQVKHTGRNTLVCDSYNANPSSMHSALSSFAALDASPKAVMLGDMLELGERSEEEHERIIGELKQMGTDKVMLTGSVFSKTGKGSGFFIFPDVSALSDFLRKEQLSGYTILIKGSRGIGMEKVYDLL